MTETLTWENVYQKHRTFSGISVSNGLVSSLLCNASGKGKYPNQIGENKITYYVGSMTQSYGVKALFQSFDKQNNISIFLKTNVNQWKELGDFVIIDCAEESGGYISFSLIKV